MASRHTVLLGLLAVLQAAAVLGTDETLDNLSQINSDDSGSPIENMLSEMYWDEAEGPSYGE